MSNQENNNTNLTDNKKRDFILDGKIQESSVKELAGRIIEINRYDVEQKEKDVSYVAKPINIIVNTFGGSLYDSLMLAGIIDISETPVHTYCYGKAMSGGFVIFASGHKRFGHPLAVFMYHNASFGTHDSIVGVEQYTEQIKKDMKRYDDYLLSVTNVPKHLMDKAKETKTDWYITTEEAFHYGLVDEIIPLRNRR